MALSGFFFFGTVFVAGAVFSLLFALGIFGQSNKAVRERLKNVRPVVANPDDRKAAILRVRGSGEGITRWLATAGSIAKIERNLQLAGRPEGWTVTRVVGAKVLLSLMGIFFLVVQLAGNPSLIKVVFGIAVVFAAYLAPGVVINRRGEERQGIIQQELPDVLDQVTVSIEAGMGFEAAFARIGDRRSGPLAEEIIRTAQDMRLGMSRRDAYQAMAERTNVDDLRRFVKSIVQAEQYGVSISSVVRTQSVEMRFKRRTRAEAKALKVPVKILFPMFVCIFPVLFIVILTPAFINLSAELGSGR